MKCVIIEDSPVDRQIIEKLIELDQDLILKGAYENAIEAISLIKTVEPDLIFLDVEMPGMSGFEFLEAIRDVPQVIMITSHAAHAVEAYENDITDFILKPVDKNRFGKAVAKAKKIYEWVSLENQDDSSILIRCDRENVQLKLRDILFIEAMADYIRIQTKTDKHMVLSSMKTIATKLPTEQFARIHRSFFVNAKNIDSFSSTLVSVSGHELPVSRSGKKELSAIIDN